MHHAERGLAPVHSNFGRAVKIENNTNWNFKEFREMRRNTETLKGTVRNTKES